MGDDYQDAGRCRYRNNRRGAIRVRLDPSNDPACGWSIRDHVACKTIYDATVPFNQARFNAKFMEIDVKILA